MEALLSLINAHPEFKNSTIPKEPIDDVSDESEVGDEFLIEAVEAKEKELVALQKKQKRELAKKKKKKPSTVKKKKKKLKPSRNNDPSAIANENCTTMDALPVSQVATPAIVVSTVSPESKTTAVKLDKERRKKTKRKHHRTSTSRRKRKRRRSSSISDADDSNSSSSSSSSSSEDCDSSSENSSDSSSNEKHKKRRKRRHGSKKHHRSSKKRHRKKKHKRKHTRIVAGRKEAEDALKKKKPHGKHTRLDRPRKQGFTVLISQLWDKNEIEYSAKGFGVTNVSPIASVLWKKMSDEDKCKLHDIGNANQGFPHIRTPRSGETSVAPSNPPSPNLMVTSQVSEIVQNVKLE
jgi:hypothetical protein